MQTLTAGSFLNLENFEAVEALKFTARRLADHTAGVITAENLNAHQLENLANNLWDKAAYVTRETERRRLQQIFVENFSERLRELKPCIASTENRGFETPPANSVKEFALPSEGERDEFLGIVKTDEPFIKATVAENDTPETLQTEIEHSVVQNSGETAKPENDLTPLVETPNSENQTADLAAQTEVSVKETSNVAKTEEIAKAAPAGSKPQVPASAVIGEAKTAYDKEPFEFEKCTINLNLTLLPTESGNPERKVIISAVSHNLPPEIDFLEITEDSDLTRIADSVREKLARFRQTLPVKYIEQLRAAKTKSAKNNTTTKPNANTPPQSATNSTSAEKPQTETKSEENKTNALPAPVPTVIQSVGANEIQQSLF